MDLTTLQGQADKLVAKIKHYLITRQGKLIEQVSDEEVYDAFSMALREEVMVNWTASFNTYQKKNCKILYYLSMEYLPGKILDNTIKNLRATELCRTAIEKLGRDYHHIVHCEREPGLGNGGLGRLASCFLDSLATLKIPAVGYGLRYQYGTFEQAIFKGQQIERPDRWLLRPHPWEFRRDYRDYLIHFGGTCQDEELRSDPEHPELREYEEIRATCYDLPIVGCSSDGHYSVVTQRLWSTKESPQNFRLQTFNAGLLQDAAENMILTDVLYPNDEHDVGKRIRLKQEYLLVSASLQDILRRHLEINPDLTNLPEKVCIQINDTHPSLLISEMMRLLIDVHHVEWDQAWEWTKACIFYTNHTILSEALEVWSAKKLKALLPRQFDILKEIDRRLIKQGISEKLSIVDDQLVKMAHLSIHGSTKVNGVAHLHGQILKQDLFKDFLSIYPDKFLHVTNGVTQRRWLFYCNEPLTNWITQKIGKEWLTDFKKIEALKALAHEEKVQNEFLEIKKLNKQNAIDYIYKYHEQFRSHDPYVKDMLPLGADSLFDIQIKRIHEYKRQLMMMLHLIIVYLELKEGKRNNPIPRTAIFGGKAAPGYERAKDLIYWIHVVAKTINSDEQTNSLLKVIFVENYNVTKAEILIPAADLSEQISLAGKEASGTGNMKFSMNGALTIGTEDGANIEMREAVGDSFWPFRFGASTEEVNQIKKERRYFPNKLAKENPRIQKVLETLKNDTFAKTAEEKEASLKIYDYLLKGFNPDPYFSLYDLESYYQTQLRVEELYRQPLKWAEFAIQNLSSMAFFSSDRSIETYAQEIWNIQKQEVDAQEFEQVKKDFLENDRCRIN